MDLGDRGATSPVDERSYIKLRSILYIEQGYVPTQKLFVIQIQDIIMWGHNVYYCTIYIIYIYSPFCTILAIVAFMPLENDNNFCL